VSTAIIIVEIAVALGLIIFVHECGHFFSAKLFGVRVNRFALGMGPIIVKWQRGETEYSLRWIPVGGFVDLAGEHPTAEDGADPRGLCNKPAWQKIVVFSAGVVMNGVLAIVLFTVAPMVGMLTVPPVIGGVAPDRDAGKAGLKAGDRIVSIDGQPIESFQDILNTIIARPAGSRFTIVVQRTEPGSTEPKEVVFDGVASKREEGDDWPKIGIGPEYEPKISGMALRSPEEQAGLKENDLILAVNGQPVSKWSQLTRALEEGAAGPVVLRIRRGGKEQDLPIDPAKLKDYKLGMVPPVIIGGVQKNGPAAKAGVKAGDRAAALNDEPWPTLEQFTKTIRAGEAGSTVRLALWRDGERVDVAFQKEVLPNNEGSRIGFTWGLAAGRPAQIGNIDPGGAADLARLMPGDIVLQANDKKVSKWPYLREDLLEAPDKPSLLQIQRGQTTLTATYQVEAAPLKRFIMEQSAGSPLLVTAPRNFNPVKAVTHGLRQTYQKIGLAYASIRQLSTGEVSTETMGGPVRIIQIAYEIGTYGLGTAINFWAMLSVFVGVLNFLPIPPFDGGHVLFVMIDAVKGKPVSMKTRQVVWLVGWAMVGLLFIFVTYQDVGRLVPEGILRWLGG